LAGIRSKSIVNALQHELVDLPPQPLLTLLEKRSLRKESEWSEEIQHDVNLLRAYYATRCLLGLVALDSSLVGLKPSELLNAARSWLSGMTKVRALAL
jgi:hypothetical protein